MSNDKHRLIRRTEKQRIQRQNLLEKALAEIKDEFKEGLKVLDIGCGDGILLTSLYKNGGNNMELHGMDYIEENLKQFKEKAENENIEIRFFSSSIADIPKEDACYDIVFCTMMFHHLDDSVKIDGMREMKRVLKKGGKLVFVDLCYPEGLITKMIFKLYFAFLNKTHDGTIKGINNTIQKMRDNGFTIKKEKFLGMIIKLIVAES